MSSFKSKHFHSVVAAYASDDVKVEVSPYHFCRPGVILFLPDLNMDSYRDFTVVGLRPGSEVAHIPDQKFHDSGWIYHYQYRNFDSTCTEMENGWIRFWFPDIPAPCENFIERLFTSREDRWTLEAAWLSQAHYIFSRYGIKNDLDSYAFFRRTTYSVSLLDSSHSSMEHTLSGGIFLFLSPIAAGHNPGLWGPAYPAPAFWSLEPSGSHGLLFEDAQALGLPTLSVSASIRGYRWSTEIYRGLVEFQRGKGFNPDSLNVALHCGLPLYQPSLHDGVYPYVELI
ncbi:hypothetical protein B0H16DRAFT_529216 [Mycena metata]|uniref:Uncharacterized protein n=1 Tax=Mycena metata TaxID=1033252 RepID=A0AAD7NI86_9AGAR|nr:hypothetical protein B0H16DRAFT_529216 [Mycena metata]